MPDGTIPTGSVTLEREEKAQDTFSERPFPEAPKETLVEEKGRPRAEDEGIKPVESDESTIPLPGQPRGGSSAATETIPSHANDLQQPSKSSQVQQLEAGHDRDVFYARSVESQPTPSPEPRTQLPKYAGTRQASDEHVDDKQLNQDVFYSQETSAQDKIAAKDELPEGINTDVFHSNRVAQMLGSDPYSRKEHARRKAPPSRNPFIPPQYQAGHGHETTAKEQTQTTTTEPPTQQSQPATTEKEMQDLASQLAQDAQSNVAAAPEVRSSITYA